ncbi:MAG: hypothetical protein N2045_10420 [Fimbriimonadales bacterium]|nr:hypothetical protein [Fimbriimonadales bacterium]
MKRTVRFLGWSLGLAGLMAYAVAQNSASLLDLNGSARNTPAAPANTPGQATADVLPGKGVRGPYTLRFAPVIPGSESVYVDSTRLQRDVDYAIDYASGTLTFYAPVRTLSTIQVYYRYDPQGKRAESSAALPLLALSFGQGGSLQALYAPGATETSREGVSYQISAYGLRNRLQFGGGALQGYYFVGTRSPLQAFAMPSFANPSPQTVTGASESAQFIVQNLNLNAGALQFQGNYQDIGKGFSAQKMLGAQPGLDASLLQRWEQEKGLKRYDYTLGLALGGSTLQQSVLRIQDDKGAIEQRGYLLQSNALQLRYERREAQAGFERFKDLSDAAKGDWQRERGLVREQLESTLKLAPNSTLQFNQTQVAQEGAEIKRQQYAFNLPWLKLVRTHQSVEQGFTRFGDLAEADKAQLAREVGMQRDQTQIEINQKGVRVAAEEGIVRSPSGTLERESLQIKTDQVEVEHLRRAVDADFKNLPNLTPAEHQKMVEEVRQFHAPQETLKPEDVPQALKEPGLERTLQRIEIKPGKEMSLQVKRFEVADRVGEGSAQGTLWQLRTPNLQVRLHERNITPNFNRLGDLTRFERALFHNEQGMGRSDWDVSYTTKDFGLAIARMQVHAIGAGVRRTSYRLLTPRWEFHYNEREVDADFARAHDLADPERDFLVQLRGFRQHDWTAKLRPASNLQLELFQFNAQNPLEQIANHRNRYRVMWQPNAALKIGRQADEYRSDRLTDGLYHDEYERNDLQYQLGFGQLNAYSERRQIGGTLANPLYQTTEFYRFSSSAIRNMNFALEERRTRADGAPSERWRAHQMAYTLNPRLKMSFAYAEATRDGAPDETSQQVGLEYQLKNGAKLTFSETRAGKENANGSRVLSTGLTQSAFGVLNIGANYQEWRTDRTNTKAQSQVVIQSARPFDLLWLKGLQFDFRYGALADRHLWQQENKHFTGEATLFGRKLTGGYVGLYVPGQGRAIDRYYQLQSAPNERLQYNFLYKTRTYQDGRLYLVRNYQVAYQLDQRFTIRHEFQTHPEQANPHVVLGSVLQPTGVSNWAMEWRWTPAVRLRGDYRLEWNTQQNRRTRRGGLTLIGEQADGLRWDVGYRIDSETFGERHGIAHTFYLSTERRIDSEHYLMLGVQWTHYERHPEPNMPRDQQRLVLELRRPF